MDSFDSFLIWFSPLPNHVALWVFPKPQTACCLTSKRNRSPSESRAPSDEKLTIALPFFPTGRKWFLDALGHVGLNNLLAAYEDKSAEAVCTFAFSHGPGKEPLIFQGRTLGKIVPARGPTTFGKVKAFFLSLFLLLLPFACCHRGSA
jgi:Ham1 family